ncbi:MAG: hypothetical protein A3B68_01680 [Candidatus Melainabacteria bacterium RIFCSPHIGHO2_02_FULL_34_12]|nr:MAG: hypothetical protein A3B68_01680 [Candidatus Melainabacteria bacterium RIFCSPHIGHO2_02_FULL_34_12]
MPSSFNCDNRGNGCRPPIIYCPPIQFQPGPPQAIPQRPLPKANPRKTYPLNPPVTKGPTVDLSIPGSLVRPVVLTPAPAVDEYVSPTPKPIESSCPPNNDINQVGGFYYCDCGDGMTDISYEDCCGTVKRLRLKTSQDGTYQIYDFNNNLIDDPDQIKILLDDVGIEINRIDTTNKFATLTFRKPGLYRFSNLNIHTRNKIVKVYPKISTDVMTPDQAIANAKVISGKLGLKPLGQSSTMFYSEQRSGHFFFLADGTLYYSGSGNSKPYLYKDGAWQISCQMNLKDAIEIPRDDLGRSNGGQTITYDEVREMQGVLPWDVQNILSDAALARSLYSNTSVQYINGYQFIRDGYKLYYAKDGESEFRSTEPSDRKKYKPVYETGARRIRTIGVVESDGSEKVFEGKRSRAGLTVTSGPSEGTGRYSVSGPPKASGYVLKNTPARVGDAVGYVPTEGETYAEYTCSTDLREISFNGVSFFDDRKEDSDTAKIKFDFPIRSTNFDMFKNRKDALLQLEAAGIRVEPIVVREWHSNGGGTVASSYTDRIKGVKLKFYKEGNFTVTVRKHNETAFGLDSGGINPDVYRTVEIPIVVKKSQGE